jgi:hypothetical protein
MEVLALLVAIGAAIVAVLSAVYARNSNRIAVLGDFLREFRRMEPTRRWIILELPKTEGVRLSAITPEDKRAAVTQVCFYLDGLGLLIRHRLINPEPVYSIIGKPIQRCWERLEPYIEAERTAREEERYMAGFEDLAYGASVFDYDRDLATLRRYDGSLRGDERAAAG